MKQFETGILNNGGQIVYGSEVTGIRKIDEGYEIMLLDSDKNISVLQQDYWSIQQD